MINQRIWTKLTLLAIIIGAIILRLIKLYDFAIWGSDSGEHYFLLNRLITTGEIQIDYNGWGFAYPYFPGMNLVTAGFTNISAVSTYNGLIFVVPIIAGLSVLMIYCISHRIFHDPRASLIAAAIVAVAMPHVYTSSHPMPGSLGGFLLLTSVFLILKSYDNKKFILPLIFVSISLVITHHLTIYFLIISVIGIIIYREFFQRRKKDIDGWVNRTQFDFMFLFFLITISLLFWFIYAEQFYSRILVKYLPVTPLGILFISYVTLFIFWYFIRYVRKFDLWSKPKQYTKRGLSTRLMLYWTFGIIVLVFALYTGVPGTNMETDPNALPIFIPNMILLSFITIAPGFLRYYKDGIIPLGWMAAIIVSMIFAFLTNSQELIMYRHLPYVFEPIAILIGLGIVRTYDILVSPNSIPQFYQKHEKELARSSHEKKNFKFSMVNSSIKLSTQLAASFFILVIILFSSLFSYPPLSVVSGFEEGTTDAELDSCLWSRDLLQNSSTIGSDHRMSSMVFGIGGLNASWEYIPKTFHSSTYYEIKSELNSTLLPSGRKRIDYILITKTIEDNVALEQWETAEPMSDEAKSKFDSEPFIKLYDNGEARIYYYINIEDYTEQFSSD